MRPQVGVGPDIHEIHLFVKKGRKFLRYHFGTSKRTLTRFLSRRDREDITNCDIKRNNRNWSQFVTSKSGKISLDADKRR